MTQLTTTKATTNTKAMTRWATITSTIKATAAWKEFIMQGLLKMLLETNIMFKISLRSIKKKREKRCGEYQVFNLKVLR